MNKKKRALFRKLIDDTCDKVLFSFIEIINEEIRICREDFNKRGMLRSSVYIYRIDNIFKEQLIEYVDKIQKDIQEIPDVIHVNFLEPEIRLIEEQVIQKISDLSIKYVNIRKNEIKRIGLEGHFKNNDNVDKILKEMYGYIAVCFNKVLSINKSKRPSIEIKFRRAELWISIIAILIAIISLVLSLTNNPKPSP